MHFLTEQLQTMDKFMESSKNIRWIDIIGFTIFSLLIICNMIMIKRYLGERKLRIQLQKNETRHRNQRKKAAFREIAAWQQDIPYQHSANACLKNLRENNYIFALHHLHHALNIKKTRDREYYLYIIIYNQLHPYGNFRTIPSFIWEELEENLE